MAKPCNSDASQEIILNDKHIFHETYYQNYMKQTSKQLQRGTV